jgi:hypothetical protein
MPAQLFVAPIPKDFPTEELLALFEAVGEVQRFHRPKQGDNQAGYVFVTMATDELNQAAIERLNDYPMGENLKNLTVKIAEKRLNYSTRLDATTKAEYKQVALEIAAQLNETEEVPVKTIKRLVYQCGPEQAREWLRQAFEIEANGGIMLENLGRKRTIGGIFFYISKRAMTPEVRAAVYPVKYATWADRKKHQQQKQEGRERKTAAPEAQLPTFDWGNRLEALQDLFAESGNTSSTKVVIVGRPESVRIDTNQVTVLVKRNFHLTSAPRGVPRPPAAEAITRVYIGLKMWNKVQEALNDPEDRMVAEGFCAWENGHTGLSVYATNVTTANQQKQRWAKSDTGSPAE